MALNSRFVPLMLFSLAVAAALFFNAASAAQGSRSLVAGGWTPISDPKSPEVVEIGKFAIDAHNKAANTALQFESVISGESQVVAGTNYKLVITAKDGSAGHKYEAVVYDKPFEEKIRQLTSFKQL